MIKYRAIFFFLAAIIQSSCDVTDAANSQRRTTPDSDKNAPIRAPDKTLTIQKDRLVRIFFNDNGRAWVTGDTIPFRLLNTILFLKEPCTLDIVGAEEMLRAWMAYGAYQLGCWYPTIDDQYVFVGQIASLTYQSGAYWEALPRALLHPDGSATITEPSYDSNTYMRDVMNRKAMESLKHKNERP